jgi:succinate dehydrogenase / fumarate reductase iron-sulfur subunit
MNLELHVWRQAAPNAKGAFVTYAARDISPDMSFLEMLDVVNEGLVAEGREPIAFDHDCREGICGSCGMMINGVAHGPMRATATCQLHMRHFEDGDVIWIEPWRARAFPVVKDLVVDRRAFDRIVAAGGFISVNTGSAPEANSQPVPKQDADDAMDAAACIGCGACVAAWPTGADASRCANGRADGRRGVRSLHPVRRMPGGVPEGDQHRHDRADESRLYPRYRYASRRESTGGAGLAWPAWCSPRS